MFYRMVIGRKDTKRKWSRVGNKVADNIRKSISWLDQIIEIDEEDQRVVPYRMHLKRLYSVTKVRTLVVDLCVQSHIIWRGLEFSYIADDWKQWCDTVVRGNNFGSFLTKDCTSASFQLDF